MRAQEVLIENNKKRYILLEQEGLPVMPIMKSQLHIV
ncbi:transposase, partial [Bacillus cereus]